MNLQCFERAHVFSGKKKVPFLLFFFGTFHQKYCFHMLLQ
jgi:hypothetical protein